MRHLAVVFTLLIGLLVVPAHAATVRSYNIDVDFGPQFNRQAQVIANGRLTGTIVTDGTIGALTSSNILSWTFTYGVPGFLLQTIDSQGIAGTASVTGAGSALFAAGLDLQGLALNSFDRITFSNIDGFRERSVIIQRLSVFSNRLELKARFSLPNPYLGDTIFIDTLPQNTVIGTVPVPAALPLALTGLAALGLLGRRRRSAQAVV